MKMSLSLVILICFGCLIAGCRDMSYDSRQENVELRISQGMIIPDIQGFVAISALGNDVLFQTSPTQPAIQKWIIGEGWITGVAADYVRGQLAYAEEVRPGSSYKLRLFNSGKKPSIVFSSTRLIHSLSWSNDGTKLSFLVGELSPQDLQNQTLYIVSLRNKILREVSCLGTINIQASPKMQSPRLMATQIIWSENDESIFWVSAKSKISEITLETLKQVEHQSAQRIFSVTSKAFVIARAYPWRVVFINRETGEQKNWYLPDVAEIGIGIYLPSENVIAIAVREKNPRGGDMSPLVPSVYFDLNQNTVEAKVPWTTFGFLPSAMLERNESGGGVEDEE